MMIIIMTRSSTHIVPSYKLRTTGTLKLDGLFWQLATHRATKLGFEESNCADRLGCLLCQKGKGAFLTVTFSGVANESPDKFKKI